jgi:ribosome biogenesis protein Nip4
MKEFLSEFGIKEFPKTVKLGRAYFEKPDLQEYRPLFSGKCIAHERGKTIVPSVDFLQEIAKKAKRHVIVNSKGEWLFICGRNLAGKYIVGHNNPQNGDRVVVMNEHKECIGYGEMGKEIKRVYDIGDLLRRERRPKRF